MTKRDNEKWLSFKEKLPVCGHYQISIVREGCREIWMYAYFNGRDWYDEQNKKVEVSKYRIAYRPWCEDYEE